MTWRRKILADNCAFTKRAFRGGARSRARLQAWRRDRASVTLIAVSKTFDAGAVTPVIEAGQACSAENRVGRKPRQKARVNVGLPWPGAASDRPLQSTRRGGRRAVRRHSSVDRSEHLRSVAREWLRKKGAVRPAQYRRGPQKAGVAPADADAFIASAAKNTAWKFPG